MQGKNIKYLFEVIQKKDCIYISEKTSSYYTTIPNLLFDSKIPEETYHDKWYKLEKVPTIVQKKLPEQQINIRYELKQGYKPSDIMPAVINLNSLYESEYEEIANLYERKYETQDAGYENVEFGIDIIYKQDDFEWIKKKYNCNYDLITQIEMHPELKQEAPCKVTSKQMFDVIRNYVKTNIDKSIATITSDYDFHFEVKRKVRIAEPYSYQVDTNNSIFQKRQKRPNWVTKWVNEKETSILNIKDKSSSTDYGKDCFVPPEMYGKNYIDLENKIDTYLQELMKEINIRYCECPTCKGWGIIKEESNG